MLLYSVITLLTLRTVTSDQETQKITTNEENTTFTKGLQKYIAYNCNLKDNLEFEEFNLMEVEPCESTANQYQDPINMEALIIKPKKTLQIDVIECELKASFIVNYCSYNYFTGYRLWNNNVIANSIQLHLSKTECTQAIRDHQLKYMDRKYYQKFNYIIIDLNKNGQASGWKTLRGSMNAKKGTCIPDSFAILGEQYSNHILQMKYSINVQITRKIFNIKTRVLRLNKHLAISNIIVGSYFDPTYGNYHWNSKEISNTNHHIWQEVLSGKAQLHNPKETNTTKPIAIINLENNTIAITLEDKERICIEKFHSCKEAYKTASKEIYLILSNITERRWNLDKVTIDNIDRLEEIKASAISIFLTNSLEIEKSFAKVSRTLCEKSRNLILTNIRNYLAKLPDHRQTNQNLIEAGSTIYSVRCKEILVWLAPKDSTCYKEPRIAYLEDSHNFLTYAHINPITHHIKPNSTEITCNYILPFKIAMKTIDNMLEYFCRTTNGWDPTNCEVPKKIKPLAVDTLYKTNTKKIHTSLFDSKSLELLDNQQWNVVNNEENSQVMLKMFEEIRKTHSENDNIFEYMMQEATRRIINTPIKWIHLISDSILPLLSITYILNVLMGLTMILPNFRNKTKHEVLSIKHIMYILQEILKTIFPIIVQSPHTCKCEEEMFLTEVAKQMEDQEKTRFLRNLMN